MAKIYGLFGSMTGKLADTVMTVRNGVQIARKYQPVVFNPSTPAQVATRSRMKLMSQVSAVFANFIAFMRDGSVSSRNIFVKRNFDRSSFNQLESKANISYPALDFTGGLLGIPALTVNRQTGLVSASLADSPDDIDRVIYGIYSLQDDGTLREIKVVEVTEAGTNGTFPTEDIPMSSASSGIAYAYGIRFNNQAARVRYDNLVFENQMGIVEVLRTMTQNDITLSETRSANIGTPQANLATDSSTRSTSKK